MKTEHPPPCLDSEEWEAIWGTEYRKKHSPLNSQFEHSKNPNPHGWWTKKPFQKTEISPR
jgi:hypothetical protein